MIEPRSMVFLATSTCCVLVVAVHAQAASTAPRQIATIAAAVIPGLRRSLGGGASDPAAGPGSRSSVLSSRVAVVMVPSLPLLSSLVHEHLRFSDGDLDLTGQAVQSDRSALAGAGPGDYPVRRGRDGVPVVRLTGARLVVDVTARGRLLVAVRRLVRRSWSTAGDLGAVAHVPCDSMQPGGGGHCLLYTSDAADD